MGFSRGVVLFLFCCLICPILNKNNGLVRTPPMGWNSWMKFRCEIDCIKHPLECISEHLIKRIARKMVADGFRDAGYKYIIIDDCWMEKERKNGSIMADSERFPSGIKALSDYVHSLGLSFGIYLDIGTKTCMGYPGSYGHYEDDINQLVSWNVDYLKLDGCYLEEKNLVKEYINFSKNLTKLAPNIVFSCSYPAYLIHKKINYRLVSEFCNLWRNFDDIDNDFSSVLSIMSFQSKNENNYISYVGSSSWNDPDMLIIGNNNTNEREESIHMAFWAVMSSPLLLSADLDRMPTFSKKLALNYDLIAVNQDMLGMAGRIIQITDYFEIWCKEVIVGLACAVRTTNITNNGETTKVTIALDSIFTKIYVPAEDVFFVVPTIGFASVELHSKNLKIEMDASTGDLLVLHTHKVFIKKSHQYSNTLL